MKMVRVVRLRMISMKATHIVQHFSREMLANLRCSVRLYLSFRHAYSQVSGVSNDSNGRHTIQAAFCCQNGTWVNQGSYVMCHLEWDHKWIHNAFPGSPHSPSLFNIHHLNEVSRNTLKFRQLPS